MTAQERTKFKGFADTRIIEEIVSTSPRAVAIVCASLLENHLEQLLAKFLLPDAKKLDEMISGNNISAPLGNFASKMKMCYLLGLISEEMYKDLDTIKKIRNKFAHQLHGCNFTDSTISDWIKNFYFINNIFEYDVEEHPQLLFSLEVMCLGTALIKKVVRCEPRKKLTSETGSLGWEEMDYKWMTEDNPYHPGNNSQTSSEGLSPEPLRFKSDLRVKGPKS